MKKIAITILLLILVTFIYLNIPKIVDNPRDLCLCKEQDSLTIIVTNSFYKIGDLITKQGSDTLFLECKTLSNLSFNLNDFEYEKKIKIDDGIKSIIYCDCVSPKKISKCF